MSKMIAHRPMLLIVLDGWGYSENTLYNAIHSARTPTWDRLWYQYPSTLINASGMEVGLPDNQMGNSEVGHMNIGSGRLVAQEYTRITDAIDDGSFFENPVLKSHFERLAASGKQLHILGLLSPGGVHSHQEHVFALMESAARHGIEKINLHAFLDGRDTRPQSAEQYLDEAQIKIRELGRGRIASICGRYFAMDRNKHWDRTKRAYDLIVGSYADYESTDAFIAVDLAYARGETDEFISPTTIIDRHKNRIMIDDGDLVVFANYRADRVRQLTEAFVSEDFAAFQRRYRPELAAFISMTEYKSKFDIPVAFPPLHLSNVFGEYVANLGLHQLRIAETEKYAHVTFFFNGGEEKVFPNEDRILIPSPHVATYDERPEMSAFEVTEKLLDAVRGRKYDTVICNFANADMVGHTGNFDAAVKAIECIDTCLDKIVKAVLSVGGELLITADHGNAEQMRSFTTEKIKVQEHTAHTSNLVPLVYIGRPAEFQPSGGTLSDVAPTMLYLMGLAPPREMTGRCLLTLAEEPVRAAAGD